MIRYSFVTCFLIILALTGNPVSGAEDSDYEIIDPELLLEEDEDEDEETITEEPDEEEIPDAAEAEENIGAVMEVEQTSEDAETMNAAYTALQNQEYDVAHDLFYSLASQDNAPAQYELGALYHRGAGVDADVIRASSLYTRAAEQGYAEAQYRLGNMYLMGEGVRQSDSEAAHWYEKAAQQGHADARSNLSNLQRISAAKTRDVLEREAASLPPLKVVDRTAAGGKKEKRGFFKRIFSRDDKTRAQPVNPDEEPATQQGVPDAHKPPERSKTDIASVKNDEEAGSSTPKTRKKGFFSRLFGKDDVEEEKTSDAMKPAGAGGNEPDTAAQTDMAAAQRPAPLGGSSAVSNYELGMAYASGDTLEQDILKAFEYLTRSAQQGYAPAQYRLGVAYANGDGTGKDLTKAVEWYEKSARQGHIIAQRSLAVIYLDGQENIAQNKPLALAWYNLLAESGNRMDIHRRDFLLQELSDPELQKSQEITTEIQNHLAANSE